jgi:4-hydroxy-tetrahydrodipicolinate synthase
MQVPGYTPMREYSELAYAGDFAAAGALRDGIAPLREVHERWIREPWLQHHLIPIAQIKAWCDMIGMVGGPVRPPLLPLTAAETAAMQADLAGVGLLDRVASRVRDRAA